MTDPGSDQEKAIKAVEGRTATLERRTWEMEVERILGWGGVASCIECGRCTASCPAAIPSHLRARNVVRAVQEGDRSIAEDLDDIWHCTTCFDCQDRCPKGVKVTEIILRLRSFGSGLGRWPEPHDLAFREIASTGNTFPLDDEVRKVRGRLSLPLDPPDCAHDEEELAAYKRLLDILDFGRLRAREPHHHPPTERDEDDGGDER